MNIEFQPLVCIIMPVYNGEKTIHFALASLMQQTYENWICVIVNDGSTDGTIDILDSIRDSRFHIYHLEHNQGRGHARDVALSHAEGKYLAYLDVDDMLHRDKLKIQVEYLEKHPDIRMVGCGCITYDENFEVHNAKRLTSFQSIKIMEYGQALPLSLPTIMVRLDQAKKFNYNHYLDVGEDYDYFARYCEGYKYGNIGKPYYYYQTGTVTAKKLFYYQFNSLRDVVVTWQRGRIFQAIILLTKRCFKIVAYSILIPFLGVKRLVNYRNGQCVSPSQLSEFIEELNHIKCYASKELSIK